MDKNTLASNPSPASAFVADAANYIRRHSVATIVEFPGRLRCYSGSYALRFITYEGTGDHISRVVISGTASERGYPSLRSPCEDGAIGIDSGALVDHARGTIVLAPSHLIFSGKLYAHRAADRL
jgi:hypothetical protein